MAASLFAFVAAAILGRSWAEASRGFEPRSLDSESRVLTVTPRGHIHSKATPLQSIHEHVISIITHRFAIFAQPPLWDMILPSIPYSCQSRVFSPHGGIPPHMGVWRNGSASDSRSEGWEFESLCPHLHLYACLTFASHVQSSSIFHSPVSCRQCMRSPCEASGHPTSKRLWPLLRSMGLLLILQN